MAKRKRNATTIDPWPGPGSDETPEPATENEQPEPERSRALGDRVTIWLTPDGRPDWPKMRAATRERVDRAFGTGPTGDNTAAAEPFDPSLTAALYDVCSTIIIAFGRMRGWTPEQTRAMVLTGDDKAILVPPTSAVLGKYLPGTVIAQYSDEALLAMAVFRVAQAKLVAFRLASPVVRDESWSGPSGDAASAGAPS